MIIQQALLMVESHPSLTWVLTRATRRVLKALVTRCSKDDGCAPIHARASNVAKEAACDTRTVTRALAALNELGYVEKIGDGRDDNGKYKFLDLKLTPLLAKLLRLPAEGEKVHRTKMSDGPYIGFNQSFFKEDYPGIPDEKIDTPKPTPAPSKAPASSSTSATVEADIVLPPELDPLPQEFEISRKGIANLRGQAHRAGYNLAHIVACARQRMTELGAKSGRAFRYLEKMIGKSNADYAGRASQAGRVAANSDFEARAITAAKKHVGKAYVAPDGVLLRFRADGKVEMLDGGTILGFLPTDQIEKMVQRIEAGELRAPSAAAARSPSIAKPLPSVSSAQVARAALAGALKAIKPATYKFGSPMPA